MEFRIPAEVLEECLSTLKAFVYKPSNDASMYAMSAAHITADADADTVTFVGNNPSQRLSFSVAANVSESGEVLSPVSDFATALSTIADKAEVVRVVTGDTSLTIHSKTVSVEVPALDVASVRVRPKAPKVREGDMLSITVKAEALPTAFARALPGGQGSEFPQMLMWVNDDELCLMSLARGGASFASTSGAKVSGSAALVTWEAETLRRIVGLCGGADEVKIAQDEGPDGEPAAEFTVTVKGKDTTFIVEQTRATGDPAYEQARSKIIQQAGKIKESAVTTVTVKCGDITRALESTGRVRSIGRATPDALENANLSMSDEALLTVWLPNESFSEEIGGAKATGALPRDIDTSATRALSVLHTLGADAKVTLHLPAGNGDRTVFALLTTQDTTFDAGDLPVSGYWALIGVTDKPSKK